MTEGTRQTQSFLRRRFQEVGIEPVSRHGQNFLIDLNLLDILFQSVRLEPRDVVLEIGTGTGSLTALMAQAAGAVVSVEIDPRMHQLASEELIDFENVTLLHQDALKNKNTFHPLVLETVRKKMAAIPNSRFKLAANLPYNIATPILSNLLSTDIVPHSMTVTIQKEVADRITASPSTKDYGALSIWMQSQCDVELVRIIPPTAFWPRPKVHSAILHVTVREDLRQAIPDREFFHTFTRAIFMHRRKLLRGVMLGTYKNQLGKSGIDEIIAELGLKETCRAEELDVAAMLRLCEATRLRLQAVD